MNELQKGIILLGGVAEVNRILEANQVFINERTLRRWAKGKEEYPKDIEELLKDEAFERGHELIEWSED